MPTAVRQKDINVQIFRAPYDIPKQGAATTPPTKANSFYPVFFYVVGISATRTFTNTYYCYLTPQNLAFVSSNSSDITLTNPGFFYDWYPAYDAGLVYQGEQDKIALTSHYGQTPLVPNFSNTRNYAPQPSRVFSVTDVSAGWTVANLHPMVDVQGRHLIGQTKYYSSFNRIRCADAFYVYDTMAPLISWGNLGTTALFPPPNSSYIWPNYSSGSNHILNNNLAASGDMRMAYAKLRLDGLLTSFDNTPYEALDFDDPVAQATNVAGQHTIEGIFTGGFVIRMNFGGSSYLVINHTGTRWAKLNLQSQIGSINFNGFGLFTNAIDPNGIMYFIGNIQGSSFPVYYSAPLNLSWNPQILRFDPSPIALSCWSPCISVL